MPRRGRGRGWIGRRLSLLISRWRSDVPSRRWSSCGRSRRGSLLGCAPRSSGSDPHNSTDIYYEFKSLDHLDQEGRGAAVGVSWCLETHTNYTCDHGHIAFDPATNGGIGDYTDTELKSIACHETGHALGQTHPPTNSTSTYGCMVTNTLYPMVHGHNVNDIENNWHY